MWEPDTLRAGSAGPGRSEDGMSGEKKRGSARAVPRAYGRLTDLCQDFGHASSRNQAAIGMASGLGSVLSKKAAMASAGTL